MTEWILLFWIQVRWNAITPIEQLGPYHNITDCWTARDKFLREDNVPYGEKQAVCIPVPDKLNSDE